MNRPDKETLSRLYFEDRLNTVEIGKIYGVAGRTVRDWMALCGIKLLGPAHLRKGVSAHWNVGRERSERHREKLSAANKGKVAWNKGTGSQSRECRTCGTHFFDKPYRRALYCSSECRGKARGAQHFNFKGEGAGYIQRQRNWEAYTEWRKAVLSRDQYQCRKCLVVGGRLTAHHLNSWASHPEQRFQVANGAALCWPCHWSFHRAYGHRHNTAEQYFDWLPRR